MSRWRDDPSSVRPMLASLEEPPIVRSGWVYEPKYDGIRALVDVRPSARRGGPPTVAIYSRNGRDKQAQFPGLVRALGGLARRLAQPALFDGEIVAINRQGVPLGFQHIQQRIHLTAPGDIVDAERVQPAALVLFDVLRDGGEDLRGQPLAGRRLRLQKLVRPRTSLRQWIRLSDIADDDGRALLARARREKWEGLIAKDGQSVYQSGRRTPACMKLKLLRARCEIRSRASGSTSTRVSRPR